MGRSLNKAMLIGNLGKDPEVAYTPSGLPVANFSIATSESWKDEDGNKQEKTEWHNIVAWRKLAEICAQYLKKGSKIFCEGRIETRSWDDKNTGTKRYKTEIVIQNMIMLDGPRQGETHADSGAAPGQTPPAERDKASDDDLPF